MTRLTLTKTQRDLLKQMRFREAGEHGAPCWIVGTAYGRYWLLVRTMMNSWERHARVNASTLRTLRRLGLIEIAPDVQMPDWFKPERLDDRTGSTITLTDAGRLALDGAR